jgi:hypothetical protein
MEQLGVIITESGQNLCDGEEIFVLTGGRVLVDVLTAATDDLFGRAVEESQRGPRNETDVVGVQEVLGG